MYSTTVIPKVPLFFRFQLPLIVLIVQSCPPQQTPPAATATTSTIISVSLPFPSSPLPIAVVLQLPLMAPRHPPQLPIHFIQPISLPLLRPAPHSFPT